MIVLFVGGPWAGEQLKWPDPLPPAIVVPKPLRGEYFMTMEDALNSTVRPGVLVVTKHHQGVAAMYQGRMVCPYYDRGDPHRVARTLEWIVGFTAPRALEELEAKVAVEALIRGF